MTTARAETDQAWLALYDSDCGFCRWSLGLLLDLDRHHRLRPLPLSSPQAAEHLSDLTPEQRMASWHLVSPAGQRWSGGEALAPVARLLGPAGQLPAALLDQAPAVADRGYRWVAAHRTLLGRWVPSAAKRRATREIARRQ
jgi:predicted DCC family thiol-disulfide oxidoreductase YuxK